MKAYIIYRYEITANYDRLVELAKSLPDAGLFCWQIEQEDDHHHIPEEIARIDEDEDEEIADYLKKMKVVFDDDGTVTITDNYAELADLGDDGRGYEQLDHCVKSTLDLAENAERLYEIFQTEVQMQEDEKKIIEACKQLSLDEQGWKALKQFKRLSKQNVLSNIDSEGYEQMLNKLNKACDILSEQLHGLDIEYYSDSNTVAVYDYDFSAILQEAKYGWKIEFFEDEFSEIPLKGDRDQGLGAYYYIKEGCFRKMYIFDDDGIRMTFGKPLAY